MTTKVVFVCNDDSDPKSWFVYYGNEYGNNYYYFCYNYEKLLSENEYHVKRVINFKLGRKLGCNQNTINDANDWLSEKAFAQEYIVDFPLFYEYVFQLAPDMTYQTLKNVLRLRD